MTDTIYFLSDQNGAIKIGFSSQAKRRIASLSSGAKQKCALLGTIHGTRADERWLHERLSEFRLHGEWFEDCEVVRSMIAGAIEGGVLRPTETPAVALEPLIANARQIARRIALCSSTIMDGDLDARLKMVSAKYGIAHHTLWKLNFRADNNLGTGAYFALLDGAARLFADIEAQARADRAFVGDIAQSHLDATAQTLNLEQELGRLRAVLGGGNG